MNILIRQQVRVNQALKHLNLRPVTAVAKTSKKSMMSSKKSLKSQSHQLQPRIRKPTLNMIKSPSIFLKKKTRHKRRKSDETLGSFAFEVIGDRKEHMCNPSEIMRSADADAVNFLFLFFLFCFQQCNLIPF